MKQKKTVFVIGAGASAQYGYPTGSRLKSEIIELGIDENLHLAFTSSTQFRDLDTGIDDDLAPSHSELYSRTNPFFNLAETLKRSGQFSIDEFLRTHQSLLDVGKFTIAYVLLKNELEENLIKDEWCQLIWSHLAKGKRFPNEIEPDIAFITFNYDTSLEYIFSEALTNTFPESKKIDVESFFSNVPILHIHGKIKTFPWEGEGRSNLNRIGLSKFKINEIVQMSKGIKLFHEENEESILTAVKNVILGATNIVFLGFGFDVTNIAKMNQVVSRTIHRKILNSKYPNPAIKRVLSQSVSSREIEESVFATKRLLATGIGLNNKHKENIKKTDGMQRLQFVEYQSIFEFLSAHVDEYL